MLGSSTVLFARWTAILSLTAASFVSHAKAQPDTARATSAATATQAADRAQSAGSARHEGFGLVPEGRAVVAATYENGEGSAAYAAGVARAFQVRELNDDTLFVRLAVGRRWRRRADFLGDVATDVAGISPSYYDARFPVRVGVGIGYRLGEGRDFGTVLRSNVRAHGREGFTVELGLHSVRLHDRLRLEGMVGARFSETNGIRRAAYRQDIRVGIQTQVAGVAHAVFGRVQFGGGLLVAYGESRRFPGTSWTGSVDDDWNGVLVMGGTVDIQVEFAHTRDDRHVFEALLIVQPTARFTLNRSPRWEYADKAVGGIRLRLR